MTRRLSPALAMLVAGVALLAAAAAPGGSGAVEGRKGGTLRLASVDDVTVDTALAYDPTSWPIQVATCAKLFNYLDADGAEGTKVVEEVVRDYDLSADRRTYTFELRRTFRFHTGAPVTAQSFADAFDRVAQPILRERRDGKTEKVESLARGFMGEIVGAQAVMEGKAARITGVRVLGRYRLQIRLTRPVGDFIFRLTLPFFCPIVPGTPSTETATLAGSGPYYVAEYVPNQRIVLRRNRFYRGARTANVDQVEWTIGITPEACLLAVEEDRIDHCVNVGIPPAAYKGLYEKYGVNRPGGRLFVSPRLATWYLVFNHDRPAFRGRVQIPLKKAINYVIDRPALTRPFGYLAGKRTDQVLPPALGRAASIYPLDGPNLAAARREYAKALYEPTKLVLYIANRPATIAMAQSLEFDLKKLGIDLELKYFDHAVAHEKVAIRGEPYDLFLQGWIADYPDGGNFLATLLDGRSIGPTDNYSNQAYFDDPETNARIDAANRLSGEARREAWADLDVDLMRDNPPLAPIFHQNQRAFVSKSFGCFVLHPLNGVSIVAACKK